MKRNKLFFEITFWLILSMLIPIVSFASEFSKDTAAIEKAAKSVLKLEVMDHNNYLIATGSGFIAFDHTSLITNYHVVEGAGAVVAISDEGNRYQLDSVLCADKEMDIAILGFSDPVEYEPLKLYPDKNHPRGLEVIAIRDDTVYIFDKSGTNQ